MDERESPESADAANVVIERCIEWMDTDAAGQHHNTVIMRLVEAAEAVLHSRLGIVDATFGRTPRVRSEMNFRARLRFNDLVRVRLWVGELGRSSLRYGFTVHCRSELAADGSLVIVYFDPERECPVEWPPEHRAPLLTAGEQWPELLGSHRH